MKPLIIIFSFIVVFAVLLSCGDNSTNNVEFPDYNVSFSKSVQPFLKVTCATQGCHSATNGSSKRILEDYFSLFQPENVGLIRKGDPDGSVLVQIIENTIPHTPPVNWYITDNQKRGIRKWIQEGALNN